MKFQQAILQRMEKIARRIACRGVVCAFLLPASAVAATPAHLSIDVNVLGIGAVLNLTAAASGVATGTINLSWTEPVFNGATDPRFYDIRVSTSAQISNDADFNAARPLSAFSSSAIPAPGLGGGTAAMAVAGLKPVVYYFAIREHDSTVPASVTGSWVRDVTNGWNVENFASLESPLPVPQGLAAAAGLNKALVTWTPLTAAQKGLYFASYHVQRSTCPGQDFADVAITTAAALTDKFLTPFTTYYYRVSARDLFGRDSVFSSTASVTPYDIPPLEPLGLLSGNGSFTWSPTRTFQDNTPFDSTGTPTINELQGYRVLRSSANICGEVFYSSITVASNTYTDTQYTAGDLYYYRIQSYNTAGPSTPTMVVSNDSAGSRYLLQSDCVSRLVINSVQAQALSRATNGQGADIQIQLSFRLEDAAEGEGIIQSAQWVALKNGVVVPGFHFDTPATIILHYNAVGGVPQPLARPSAQAAPAAHDSTSLGMYWFNGAQFEKLYGKVDPDAQTVTVQTPNLGIFQIRYLQRSSGAVFDISNLSGRVITPNGDGKNDTLIFGYDPGPDNVAATGRIYDLKGAFVADMTPGPVPNTLTWDGRMNGRYVASGVYAYEIKGGGKTFSGTIVVAR
jgi:hypothetical protein